MNDDLIKIEVDGVPLEAKKGQMLIEITDKAGITVPRFCYHKKLSVAANCRMCLVEVEKAPKPLPACATPVMDGMKVYTQSAKAIAAQKGTMEFLLINHPLDCPICDQGGECELQDVSMGYGGDVSRFVERKRVVKDKDIGPLISTEMTRCIHCTRCVRFGEEIAGCRELGATGRGEHTEIGTYIKTSLTSELSGNVIDLCPVGALTAKPSRYKARAWEIVQHPSIATHDAVGSNTYLHLRRGHIVRVVPRENEQINEIWLSDRDRFSYQGLYSEDRVQKPMVRVEAELHATDWETAVQFATRGIKKIIGTYGAEQVGVLASPNLALEDLYLVQKFARTLGIFNIDHRLRQVDFSNDPENVVYPSLEMSIADLEHIDNILLIGTNIRMEQPMLAHRLRKAAMRGAHVFAINPRDFGFAFPLTTKITARPSEMLASLRRVALMVAEKTGKKAISNEPLNEEKDNEWVIADALSNGRRSLIIFGQLAIAHPAYSDLRSLVQFISNQTGTSVAYIGDGANASGAVMAGVLPCRGPGAKLLENVGLDTQAMFSKKLKAYVLIGIEPEFDCINPGLASEAIGSAQEVLALTSYLRPGGVLDRVATCILPISAYAESGGTLVNIEGNWQTSSAGGVRSVGESRPVWKVSRVMANVLGLEGFEYTSSDQIIKDMHDDCSVAPTIQPANLAPKPDLLVTEYRAQPDQLERIAEAPVYSCDAVVRRAVPLQQTQLATVPEVRINPALATRLQLNENDEAVVSQGKGSVKLRVRIDSSIADGAVWVPACIAETAALGEWFGSIEVRCA
ncbi:NADH dehydrogenase subunit G [Plasticicumulans lactativorans]|uniref:NADH-quinone oxidoreductase n=1 Tax=Plasticicumulans lactativorans TaxID=1133106 RepID=A0A4R2LC07_9GAMM|nr:NADH-quinone oxidoreductase subunit NuoG [Plasticicumulans lactativorans]TCO83064.1 NADH dehydrogenase subunit G [Plasticicumulans lactativorans]